jgi:hypothetical protein
MDIMNNMTVSTSKLTFSLIAVFALFISGSAMLTQDASAFNAPEFTCNHINTTATHCTFNMSVNGTLRIVDWGIRDITTNTTNIPFGNIDYTTYAISNIANSTNTGIGLTVPSAEDVAVSNAPAGITDGLGFLNGTDFVIIHAAIPSDAAYYINYTNAPATGVAGAAIAGGFGAFHTSNPADGGVEGEGSLTNKILKIGSNATAADWMSPTITSAEILKSNPSQIKILMSETVAVVNSTHTGFTLNTLGGANDAVTSSISGSANLTNYIYLNLQNPATHSDVITLNYSSDDNTFTGNDDDNDAGNHWITDALNSLRWAQTSTDIDSNGVGNRLANITSITVTNWIPIGFYGDVTTCYDCIAPTVTDVKVSLDSSTPITVNDDNKVHINASIGDTVSVMVTVADNLGADTIPFAGIYTNFGNTPDNLYYANNFDSAKQMSTSYYEWNVRDADTAFDNNGDITWDDATAKVNSDRTQTFTYTMTINDEIESSQVWVDIGDKVGNYAKISLPITLEVSGAPGITFASDDSQKVVSFFNESILLAIVSQWAATSSDDASNVEQLSSVLGIESQLPTWTTDLASWVADDKIDVADMIVAVEYVINQ